jgi:hypothetical protein
LIEEDFYSLFAQKLKQSVDKLPARSKPDEWAKRSYLNEWHPFDAFSEPKGSIVSCDGSIGESIFSGGLEAWVARAVAHIRPQNGTMTSVPNVEVPVGYSLGGKAIFLKTVELETLGQAAERSANESGKVFAVYDGNLSLFLPARYLQRLQPLAQLFERHVKALAKCFSLIQEGRLELVGISKDSNVTYLRARLILNVLLQAKPELGEMMRRERRSLRLMARRLAEIVEHEGAKSPLRPYLNELNQPISDEGLYSELASQAGYTTPLLLGPQTRFFAAEVEKGTNDWWDSSFRKHLGGSSALEGLRTALDELYSLPPVAISYWKSRPGLATYRIDIPSSMLGQKVRTGDLKENVLADEEATNSMRELIAKLNWLSQGANVVAPLAEVDAIARLDRRLYHGSYEPLIIKELGHKGHNVRLSKRRIRDHVMRGY